MSHRLDVPTLALDRAEVELVVRALDALARELDRVAPAQLRHLRPLQADCMAFLRAGQPASSGNATGGVRVAAVGRTMGTTRVPRENEEPLAGLVTVPEAARRTGLSAAYVRRRAAVLGYRVGGRWFIPEDRLAELRRNA